MHQKRSDSLIYSVFIYLHLSSFWGEELRHLSTFHLFGCPPVSSHPSGAKALVPYGSDSKLFKPRTAPPTPEPQQHLKKRITL